MLVLPFEHARLDGLCNLEEKEFYMEGFKFWFYHRKDIQASLDSLQPIRKSIDELSEQVKHLSELLPSPKIHQKL